MITLLFCLHRILAADSWEMKPGPNRTQNERQASRICQQTNPLATSQQPPTLGLSRSCMLNAISQMPAGKGKQQTLGLALAMTAKLQRQLHKVGKCCDLVLAPLGSCLLPAGCCLLAGWLLPSVCASLKRLGVGGTGVGATVATFLQSNLQKMPRQGAEEGGAS